VVVAACGSKAPPDPAAICDGTAEPAGAIVLRSADRDALTKASVLLERAQRTSGAGASTPAVTELEWFVAEVEAVDAMRTHYDTRARTVREHLKSALVAAEALQRDETTRHQYDGIMPPAEDPMSAVRPLAGGPYLQRELATTPDGIGRAEGATREEPAHGLVELQAGTPQQMVDRAARELARVLTTLAETARGGHGPAERAQLRTGTELASALHGALTTTSTTLIAASDTAIASRHLVTAPAEATRLWTYLTLASANMHEPWPASLLVAQSRTLVMPGSRERVITCVTPETFALPAQLATAAAPVRGARDALANALGLPTTADATSPAPSLEALIAALRATQDQTPVR
jgi:hypothetical protein